MVKRADRAMPVRFDVKDLPKSAFQIQSAMQFSGVDADALFHQGTVPHFAR
jgi:hypothetical protein